MRKFGVEWEHGAIKEQLDKELSQIAVSPQLRQRTLQAAKAAKPKRSERWSTFLNREIEFTVPQLAAATAVGLLLCGVFWQQNLATSAKDQARYEQSYVMQVVSGEQTVSTQRI